MEAICQVPSLAAQGVFILQNRVGNMMDERVFLHPLRSARIVMFLTAILLAAPSAVMSEEEILPAGIYRLEMIMASATKIPFFGTSRSASRSLSLVEIHRDGDRITQTHQVCDFRVVEDSAIKIVFPEKFIASLGRHSYAVQLEKTLHGWSYRADLGVERIGYRPNSAEDKLPERIDDQAVFDWDYDGHPAATLKLMVPLLPAGDLYIVQRGQSILTGRAIQPGRVEGGLEIRQFEQRVLGARPSFLARSPEITPDPKGSRFSLSQVPAGSTCESLRKATS